MYVLVLYGLYIQVDNQIDNNLKRNIITTLLQQLMKLINKYKTTSIHQFELVFAPWVASSRLSGVFIT